MFELTYLVAAVSHFGHHATRLSQIIIQKENPYFMAFSSGS